MIPIKISHRALGLPLPVLVMTPDTELAPGANHVNGFSETKESSKSSANPYETNPDDIPRDDPFLAQSAQYGRYTPHPDDFTPHYKHWYHSDPDANAFWQGVAEKFCTPEHSLNISGPREAFAAGSVVIWVDRESMDGEATERFSCLNANELSAARKVEESLREIGVAVPITYFCGTIEGRNVTVESRIPGVSLEVAWRYLSPKQIGSFKNQTRQILKHLASIDPPSNEPTYVCRGLNAQTPLPGQEKECDILFAKSSDDELCFTHNDLVPAHIIVKDDRVVGVTGWRQSGYFGFKRAEEVHRLLRNPGPATQKFGKSVSWADLYKDVYDPSKSVPLVASEDMPLPSIKTEPTGDDFETRSFGFDGTSDVPTWKPLENLKNGLPRRGSSSDRSSPANSVKPTTKKASAASKKGTAKKPAAKKRKTNDADTESVDGRSNTPASRTSKAPGQKQDSVSVAGSPAPEPKKKTKKRTKAPVTEEDEDSDDNAIFCICQRPDDHTWMIGCDGCPEWFHGKCVNVDPQDADLIEKYICKSTIPVPSSPFSVLQG